VIKRRKERKKLLRGEESREVEEAHVLPETFNPFKVRLHVGPTNLNPCAQLVNQYKARKRTEIRFTVPGPSFEERVKYGVVTLAVKATSYSPFTYLENYTEKNTWEENYGGVGL
jgi:hypothetical protein